MGDYNVTYRTHGDTTEAEHNSVQMLETEGVDLDEVVENCRELDVNADLYDAAGFRRGWVKADGSYRLC